MKEDEIDQLEMVNPNRGFLDFLWKKNMLMNLMAPFVTPLKPIHCNL